MRVVVLDGDPLCDGEPLYRVLRGEVFRVEVVHDDLGLQGQQPREVGQAVRERPVRGQVLEVTVVGRDVRPAAAGQRERVLELCPHREERDGRGHGQRHGFRGIAARPANDGLPAGDDAGDGVVVPRPDLAIVGEEAVREPGQPRQRVVVVGGQGLVGEIARGQHHGASERLEQQVVQRRVGQEDAQPPVAGRNGRGEAWQPAPTGSQQDDRPGGAREQRPLQCPDAAQGLDRGGVPDHDGERLRPPALAVPKAAHRVLVGRVAGEVVAAQALHRDDRAREQGRNGGAERVLAGGDGRGRSGGPPGEHRTADGAGDGLRVEAAVRGIAVFGLTVRAEGERPHRRLGAVVRQLLDDRCPRPAVRAVRKRVAVASVGRVPQLGQAVVAGGDVRREEPIDGRGHDALVDHEHGGELSSDRGIER